MQPAARVSTGGLAYTAALKALRIPRLHTGLRVPDSVFSFCDKNEDGSERCSSTRADLGAAPGTRSRKVDKLWSPTQG